VQDFLGDEFLAMVHVLFKCFFEPYSKSVARAPNFAGALTLQFDPRLIENPNDDRPRKYTMIGCVVRRSTRQGEPEAMYDSH